MDVYNHYKQIRETQSRKIIKNRIIYSQKYSFNCETYYVLHPWSTPCSSILQLCISTLSLIHANKIIFSINIDHVTDETIVFVALTLNPPSLEGEQTSQRNGRTWSTVQCKWLLLSSRDFNCFRVINKQCKWFIA